MSMKVNVGAFGLNTVESFRLLKRKFVYFFDNAGFDKGVSINCAMCVNVVKLAVIMDNRHILGDLTPSDFLSRAVSKIFTVYYRPYDDSYNYVDVSPFWGRIESDLVVGYNIVVQQTRPFNSFEALFRVAVEEPETIDKIYQYILRRI